MGSPCEVPTTTTLETAVTTPAAGETSPAAGETSPAAGETSPAAGETSSEATEKSTTKTATTEVTQTSSTEEVTTVQMTNTTTNLTSLFGLLIEKSGSEDNATDCVEFSTCLDSQCSCDESYTESGGVCVTLSKQSFYKVTVPFQ